ncbi:hypothetical protein [Streptomyces sp. TP-A0356]|uniref:hypothetical protein n=1 Tax=Streptomyces sp. TP-A0356 TaxID=1359208 RepID=UPI000AE3437A|nr:hypothetical protein [Streptomyces sp. TP-A0356]
MHVISLVAVSVILVLYAVAGVMALTTGRILPFPRGRVLRPRLWGSGALVSCAGVALLRFGSPARDTATAVAVFAVGMVVFVSGAVLQLLGQRVGRTSA